ncbi:biotin-dependent carboxyltransferase family protein [Gammaproteobacteria bacterium LSUCC0112]|nr:biotin-dependent carboxyltransferase family protein [Gammaproteobacteria bacterium LSUCC0112]
MIEVLLGSPMLTIQDTGRTGWRHLGVPRCGMMDELALRQGNLLLGNDEHAAGLEITSAPVLLKFLQDSAIVLMGADMQASILDQTHKNTREQRLLTGFVYQLSAGECLRLNAAKTPGQRAMLMVSGGCDVPLVMGSRSTDLMSGFGGLHGQALRAGDKIPLGQPSHKCIHLKSGVRQHSWNHQLRVLTGPDFTQFDQRSRQALFEKSWMVTAQSNRMGLRLQGDRLQLNQSDNKPSSRGLSIGVLPGLIQVPPDGQPILLAADAQTTGGYPAIASIISTDLWQLAYMTNGTRVRFAEVSLAEAHGLARHQQQQMDRLRDALTLRRAPA